jgi:hypothetical protein
LTDENKPRKWEGVQEYFIDKNSSFDILDYRFITNEIKGNKLNQPLFG